MAMASALGASVMLLVSLTACTVPTLRALRIAPIDALRGEG
jgi:ABC-type lipoprotein release transport system permease subunit